MRDVVYFPAIKKDRLRMTRRGRDVRKFTDAVILLATNGAVPLRYRAHKLQGEFLGCWECHLESDWLLVYEVSEDVVTVYRTGSHADLFE
ncbi:MAG: type II toxin-antitoxin system RelE/ParE family toxin [Minisyncoccota bacterium]